MTTTNFPSIEQFDFTELNSKIAELLGISVEPNYSIVELRHGVIGLEMTTDNLIEHAGVFQAAMTKVNVTSFNSSIIPTNDGNWTIWVSVAINYTLLGGGSNGATLLSAWFNSEGSGKWEFRLPNQ